MAKQPTAGTGEEAGHILRPHSPHSSVLPQCTDTYLEEAAPLSSMKLQTK